MLLEFSVPSQATPHKEVFAEFKERCIGLESHDLIAFSSLMNGRHWCEGHSLPLHAVGVSMKTQEATANLH